MIIISFGKWNHAAGRFFIRERIYKKGYIWTPFVKIKKRYKWHERDYKFWQWLSFKLPRKLLYFACIRGTAIATSGEYSTTIIPNLTAMDMIKRLENDTTNDSAD